MISRKDFVRALKLCWPDLAESRRRMLAYHCNAPAQTTTMAQLAKVAGYSDYTSANLHYGSTARVLTDSIGKTMRGKLRLAAIARWGDLDPDPKEPSFRFQMRPALVAAMKALHLDRYAVSSRDGAHPRRLHVLNGSRDEDAATLRKALAGRTRRLRLRRVPKYAAAGDEVVLYIAGLGIVASGTVEGWPVPTRTPSGGQYTAAIATLKPVNPPLSLATLKAELRGIDWLRYPRSYTTLASAAAESLRELVCHRRARPDYALPSVVGDEDLNYAELCQIADRNAQNRVKASQSLKWVRQASKTVHRAVLQRAQGCCEGCGSSAPFQRKVDGRPYLEAHHIVRLADEGPDRPVNVIALCPNCHRRVHEGADGRQYNQKLRDIAQRRHRASRSNS